MKLSAFKDYYRLSKPGMVYGNLLTAAAGYFLASRLHLKLAQFVLMIVGTAFIMGAACALNNLADRDIDSVMERTRKRPSATGSLSFRSGLIFALVLALVGFLALLIGTNFICVAVGVFGFIDYSFIYTYSKRKTHHSTLIGSLAGSAPIIGGYVAYSGDLTTTALLAGSLMLFWQMPHFYAIALFRESDYKKARIPLLPIVKGRAYTIKAMLAYNVLFIASIFGLYFYARLSIIYLLVLGTAAILWLVYNLKGIKLEEYATWSRKSFAFSLILVMILSFSVALR